MPNQLLDDNFVEQPVLPINIKEAAIKQLRISSIASLSICLFSYIIFQILYNDAIIDYAKSFNEDGIQELHGNSFAVLMFINAAFLFLFAISSVLIIPRFNPSLGKTTLKSPILGKGKILVMMLVFLFVLNFIFFGLISVSILMFFLLILKTLHFTLIMILCFFTTALIYFYFIYKEFEKRIKNEAEYSVK